MACLVNLGATHRRLEAKLKPVCGRCGNGMHIYTMCQHSLMICNSIRKLFNRICNCSMHDAVADIVNEK